MSIYQCIDCGCQETTMDAIKRHLRQNPTHGTSATYGKGYRLIKVHVNIRV